MVILTGTRVYSTGEKPENPIVRDVVFLISDVREEPVMQTSEEQEPVPHWSYVIDEIIPFGEYLKRNTKQFHVGIQGIIIKRVWNIFNSNQTTFNITGKTPTKERISHVTFPLLQVPPAQRVHRQFLQFHFHVQQ